MQSYAQNNLLKNYDQLVKVHTQVRAETGLLPFAADNTMTRVEERLTKNDARTDKQMIQPIYFHEDDYCQIELLPASSWQFCTGEMKRIDEFSEAHKTDFGWSDIYMRDAAPPQTLASMAISTDSWKSALRSSKLKFHSKVTTGYSSYVEICRDCAAWAGENEVAIFAEFKADIIERIWFSFDNLTEQGLQNSFEAIQQIPKQNELIIADWNWSQVIKISDNEMLFQYLQAHL